MRITSINSTNIHLQNKVCFTSTKQPRLETQINSDNINKNIAVAAVFGVSSIALLAYNYHAGSFRSQLAKDLTKELGKKISINDLKSIMTPKEMLKEMKNLKPENYVASAENIKSGIFLADLHSHSNYSDGQISVQELLQQAAEYGNKLNNINGKKFIFALTDHDCVNGVKEALKIIAQNPKRFKNVKFVTGAEISFIFPCVKNSRRYEMFHSNVEMPEMLVYNINPFSKNTQNFFNNIYKSREKELTSVLKDANEIYGDKSFTKEEYLKHFATKKPYLCFLNQHWSIYNYILTKARIIEIAREKNTDANSLYENMIKALSKEHLSINLNSVDNYIKHNIATENQTYNLNLGEMLKRKYFPAYINENTVTSKYEIGFKDIVNYAEKENAIMGFAHPGFTMQNLPRNNYLENMQKLIEQSKGRIKFSETYHQAYPMGTAIQEDELNEYNEILNQLDLIHIGGRDNHKKIFIPNIID